MKVLLSFVLYFLIATEIKAQVASSSLYITLSDIQSVQIVELPVPSITDLSEKKSENNYLSLLNSTASQVRKFETQARKTEHLSDQNNNGSQIEIPEPGFNDFGRNIQMANLINQTNKAIPLVVYQIDPR